MLINLNSLIIEKQLIFMYIISNNIEKILTRYFIKYIVIMENITKINLVSKRNKIDINGFVSELNENFSIIRPLNLTYKLSINEFKNQIFCRWYRLVFSI